jgi:anti-sigma B factor antagonist
VSHLEVPEVGSIKVRPFRLTERCSRLGCLEILVEGEVDLAVADQLQRALERAAPEHDQVLIGLDDCEFIDSTVIAMILRAHSKMTAEGRRLAVYGPSNQVHRILSVTGLTEDGLVFESLEEALSESS